MINWHESFDYAVTTAKDEGKLVVMDFYNPH